MLWRALALEMSIVRAVPVASRRTAAVEVEAHPHLLRSAVSNERAHVREALRINGRRAVDVVLRAVNAAATSFPALVDADRAVAEIAERHVTMPAAHSAVLGSQRVHGCAVRLRGGTELGATHLPLPQPAGRFVVMLIAFKGAWVSRIVGSAEDSEVFYIRKSSMRDKSQWSKLRERSHVSFTIKHVAGREIVSDAVIQT